MDPDEKCARIVSLMVLEKDVFVGPQKVSSSLIHYLCTYPSMQDKGYATTKLRRQDILKLPSNDSSDFLSNSNSQGENTVSKIL